MSSRKFLDKSLEIGTEDLLRQVLPKLKWKALRTKAPSCAIECQERLPS